MVKVHGEYYELDKIDRKIIMMLQDNARIQLKEIAKATGVTIDTVHNRIKDMKEKEILWLTTSLDMKLVGYPLLTDVKVRLKNFDEQRKEEFMNYLMKHPYCTDLIELMGNYDFTCVFISKNGDHLKECLDNMRFKFKDIIDEVLSLSVLKTHKFDTYTL